MIRIDQVRLRVGDRSEAETLNSLKSRAARLLRISAGDIHGLKIVRHAIDARKRPELYDTYSITLSLRSDDEEHVLSRARCAQARLYEELRYRFPYQATGAAQRAGESPDRPVIIGAGPAGLFAAYELSLAGFKPILLERGGCVEERLGVVRTFWEGGELDPEHNVQFGEGGAGTFSDGKLNTGVKDPGGRGREVLEIFVRHGAPGDILIEAYPHIGTDILTDVVRGMRETVIAHGGEVRFHTRVDALVTEGAEDDRSIRGVRCSDGEVIPAGEVILAIGHSARDTFEAIYGQGIHMECKPFAVGLRVEHPQGLIDMARYGMDTGKLPEGISLPAANYKLTATDEESGRGVYSFCMCPGGYVVNASSEPGRLVVNGMSDRARDSGYANSAIVVTLGCEDYGDGTALSGVSFQRELERRAYELGGGAIPVETYGDYRKAVQGSVRGGEQSGQAGAAPAAIPEAIVPMTKGPWRAAAVHEILPGYLNRAIVSGMTQFGRRIEGFDSEGTLLMGVESRTSSPVRIPRGEDCESVSCRGLYPCGEGAGYAGGITSAAMDGIRVAERVAERITERWQRTI